MCGLGQDIQQPVTGLRAHQGLEQIVVIDSENNSADLYAHLGNYNVLSLQNNYSPENYMEAIEICEKAGMEVIIIDSMSQCWDFLLDCHANMQGNSFTNWGKITPRQTAFIQKLLQSNCHIISTLRTSRTMFSMKERQVKSLKRWIKGSHA